jgi:aspartate dehydrogenase
MPPARELRVAIGGLGGIGLTVVRRLTDDIPGLRLAAVAARDETRARERLASLGAVAEVVPLGALADRADIVVECLPSAFFRAIAAPAIERGRLFMPLSVGALLEHFDLVARARETGARIHVPTGALIGLDAVRAAAEGTIRSVRMVTRKPPRGLAGAPYLEQNGISVDGLSAPLRVFEGSARDGARGFPANVNVAAALSLAGIGPDRTLLEIWADPGVERNMHRIEVDSDSARFSMSIENIPSAENPRTGRITALSVVAALRGLVSELRVGT